MNDALTSSHTVINEAIQKSRETLVGDLCRIMALLERCLILYCPDPTTPTGIFPLARQYQLKIRSNFLIPSAYMASNLRRSMEDFFPSLKQFVRHRKNVRCLTIITLLKQNCAYNDQIMQIIVRLCKIVFTGYNPLFHPTNSSQKDRRLKFMFTFNKLENKNRWMLIMSLTQINNITLGIFWNISILNWKKL